MAEEIPTLRWGIIATGWIATHFVEDLLIERPDAQARHIIQAVASSSRAKGEEFARVNKLPEQTSIYGSYAEAFADPNVDIIYIATPHAMHKQNCLDAIKHGKHVLCEKPFTVNAAEAEEVLAAAKAKGVFIMEAMWTRFFPLFKSLQNVLHQEQILGPIRRVFCDFGLPMDPDNLPSTSRLKDPALAAGSLLDIGIYSLTWGLCCLDPGIGDTVVEPEIQSAQIISDQIDVSSAIILNYASTQRQGILTSNMYVKTPQVFARIEGSKGVICVEGPASSVPSRFEATFADGEVKAFEFAKLGAGFYYEADAVALDIQAGRTENATMPHAETLRLLKIMDNIRKKGGAVFPQDK